jgi:glycosyltransferase involved in cell wall biosynthesis
VTKPIRRVYLTIYIWSEAGGMEEIVTTLACELKTLGVEPLIFTYTYLTQGIGQYEERLNQNQISLITPNSVLGKLAANWEYRIALFDSFARVGSWLLWPLAAVWAALKRVSWTNARQSLQNRVRHLLLKLFEFYTLDTFVDWQLTLNHWVRPATLLNQFGTGSPGALRWAYRHHLPAVYSEGNTPQEDEHLIAWDSIRAALDMAAQFTALSMGSKEGLVHVLGLSENRVTVIAGPVHFYGTSAAVEPSSASGLTLLYVGRLDSWKGLTTLINAIHLLRQRVQPVALVIAGGGSQHDELVTLVQEHNLADCVTFAGAVPHQKLPRYYQSAQIFVAPSLSFEGLGLVVPEAMSFGLPIIASNISAFRELVYEGENGFLVTPGDANELANAIAVLANNPAKRIEMGRKSRSLFEAGGFAPGVFARQTLAVYHKALTLPEARST